MNYFLDRIDGLSSENLTTELLGFLLDSSTYAPYQRLFYSLIFPGSELQDTEERHFEITTQMSFEEYGRPDIVIENERQVIFIENKFYASFSLENQMYRYYCYLKDNFGNKEKYLILLTIKDRISLYLKAIRSQFKEVAVIENDQELFNYLSKNGVKLHTIAWEDLFRFFGNSDFLVANLSNYIQSKYITSTILNEKEVKMINSKEVPILMDKLWAGIDKIRDILVGDNYNVLRTTQSRIFYGFAVERFWGKVYVEYYHYSWLNYSTPYIMQIRPDWVNEKYRSSEFESHIQSIEFVFDKSMDYIFPIVIKEADLAGSAAEIIKDKINQLDEMFESEKV